AGGCPAPGWSAFRAYHHGAVRLTVTANSLLIEAICGPAGDSGSNQNDITCTSGTAFDSYRITPQESLDVPPPPPPAPVSLAIEVVSPNPSAGDVQVAYALPEPGEATVDLID